jgi:predicted TIM-barrel fold metal-dependent hydrolase
VREVQVRQGPAASGTGPQAGQDPVQATFERLPGAVRGAEEIAAAGVLDDRGESYGVHEQHRHGGPDQVRAEARLTEQAAEVAAVFDRHPDLQVIAGHWGELVLFYIERIGEIQNLGEFGARRPVLDYFRENIFITGSGSLSGRYLAWKEAIAHGNWERLTAHLR